MLDWITLATTILSVLAGGGWLTSRWMRRKEQEKHNVELEHARAEADALRQRTELDYTKEVLEIYSAHIVQPLQNQINEVRNRLERDEEAITMAFGCSLYPDCPVIIKLQSQTKSRAIAGDGTIQDNQP